MLKRLQEENKSFISMKRALKCSAENTKAVSHGDEKVDQVIQSNYVITNKIKSNGWF
jgi:hypothetical protein